MEARDNAGTLLCRYDLRDSGLVDLHLTAEFGGAVYHPIERKLVFLAESETLSSEEESLVGDCEEDVDVLVAEPGSGLNRLVNVENQCRRRQELKRR